LRAQQTINDAPQVLTLEVTPYEIDDLVAAIPLEVPGGVAASTKSSTSGFTSVAGEPPFTIARTRCSALLRDAVLMVWDAPNEYSKSLSNAVRGMSRTIHSTSRWCCISGSESLDHPYGPVIPTDRDLASRLERDDNVIAQAAFLERTPKAAQPEH
jgi:hypothetical protein